MGYSQQFISWLLNDAEQITAEVAAACDAATGGVVSKHDLRPDLFGPRVTVQ
ncbi:hypothetical protein [Neorhizobium galegae]|uniref:hypothetical protein n=1 Tax=Neorhizobium galegae TaxID=399 RepID=UPI00358E931C